MTIRPTKNMTPVQKNLRENVLAFQEYQALKKAVSHLPQNPEVEADKVIIPREMWEKFQQSLKDRG